MPLASAYEEQKKQQEEYKPAPGSYSPPEPSDLPEQEFDYKTSPVNQRGEALPAGAKSWTPFGQPYFGPGIAGTLKRYAWGLMGSPTGQDDQRWEQFVEMTRSKNYLGAAKEFGAGLMGKSATADQDWELIRDANARLKQIQGEYGDNPGVMPADVRAEYEELARYWSEVGYSYQKIESAASGVQVGGVSLLSPILRGSKVAVQAVMDALSEAAIKFEQLQGATSAMRDYAAENSALPDLAANIDRTQGSPSEMEGWKEDPALAFFKSESAQEVANITSRLLLPLLNGWDAMRFWTAPGTTREKFKVLEEGWDAGRVLYSQAIKPSLLEEFKRRAAAGEDPQLLAMELQNPWAEAIGQGVLDPLNIVGFMAKAAKSANILDDATSAVRGGSLGDEAAELLADAGNLGEARAAERLTNFDDLLTKNIDRIEANRLTVNFNKATSYSPSGLRVRESKVVQTVSNVVTSSIMRGGGSADDVADFFADLSKAVGADKAVRLEAWDRLMTMTNRFGLGRYTFSDDVIETGVLLRNLTEDKELLTLLKKGNLEETAKALNNAFRRAVEKQIPTYSEVKKGAEAFRTGADTSRRAEKLAGTFEGISARNKALWNLHEGTVGNFKTAMNSLLGKFYFSQPGFAVRNAMNNFTTMFIDSGLSGTARSYYRDGKFWSIGAIEDDLRRYFGGSLPPAASGLTLTEAEKASTGVTRFNENIERGFAMRIYWKNFRDTMDKFLTPGVALPKRDEFRALGMTDEGIDHFLHVLKNEAYGNVDEAITAYTKKYGDNGLLDVWKRWNGSVSDDELKGLGEVGLTKEIDDIVATAKTPAEIRDRITRLKREITNRANSAADNPVGVNRDRQGFEFMDGIGRAEKEGLLDVDGTNRLSILIESSEKATDELLRAIGRARDTVADPALRRQFSIMEQAFSAERRGAARTFAQQTVETAWDLTRKARKSTGLQVEALWNRSILAKRGPAPKGLTAQQFLDELWLATRNDVSNNWEVYFSEGFDRLTPLIDNLAEQFPDLAPIFAKSQKASAELNMYRTAIYKDGKIFYAKPPGSVRELASRYGIATATAQGTPADQQLLATINKYSGQKFKSLDEVPMDVAQQALEARRAGAQTAADAARVERPGTGAGSAPEVGKATPTAATDELGEIRTPSPAPETQIAPPYVDGSTPIPGQMWKENSDGIMAALNKVERYMLDNYGIQAAERLDGGTVKALKGLMNSARGRITEGIAIADKIGKEWRDFALLPYGETRNFDLAASYVFPYQFWYSRSYAAWAKRVATDPQVIANYARIKESMSRINKDSPEWWRYNLEVPAHFLGLPNEHPMSFNLEANIWPLYGLTGTDFNDPQRRANWLTATVDDMGKMGPSIWSPIQWAIALAYRAKGEEELSQAWGGRIIPQTATIKAISSYFGQPVELDPGVQLFSGEGIMDFAAMDKYERNRVGRALTAMVQSGELTEEQAVEIARTQEGPGWDEAVRRATQIRAPGQISSYFFGVGLKARTEEDRITDEFYQKYYRLQNLNEAGLIAPENYQKEWDGLREQYPFMDALLLSRKAGPDRDRAYAYNVLGRIPPGQASDLYKLVGIDAETAQEFYDSKGNLAGMPESEREKFMAAMVDLGAMLAIPRRATKAEWNDARTAYKGMQEQMKQEFGEDIAGKIDEFFSLADQDLRDSYTRRNPEVQAALEWQNEQVVGNELLYEYYGGIQALERYHKGKVYDQLEEQFGADISEKWDEYYGLQISDPTEAKRYYRQHPELKRYSKEKTRLMELALRDIVSFGARLPDSPRPELTGNEPQSVGQENIAGYAAQQTPSFQFWQSEMPEVSAILADVWNSGEPVPYQVERNLDYLASQYGYQDGEQMLEAILISLEREQ